MNKQIRAFLCTATLIISLMGDALAEASPYPASGAGIPEGSMLLNESIIGEEVGYGGHIYQGCTSAFDGDASTFYNPASTGGSASYCGVALSETHILTQVCVLPREGWQQRLEGAVIQGSNDLNDWHTLYQFETAPEDRQWHVVTDFANNTGYRYFRYHNSVLHGDVAELEFYGYPGFVEPYPSSGIVPPSGSQLLRGDLIGEEIGWGNRAEAGRAAAFDGDINTSYQASATGINGIYCGVALDQRYVVTKLCIYPRNGWASRIQYASLQGSFDQQNWVTLYKFMDAAAENEWVVVDDFYGNIGYNYYRYISEEGIGDIAELELYGYAAALGDDPDNYTTVVDVSALVVTLDAGDQQPEQMTVCFGGTYAGLPIPADRDGKRFAGWYTAPEGGFQVDENTVVTRLRNHTIYARWE